MNNDIYKRITIRIIQEQEGIIGPIALEQANKVPGLNLNWVERDVEFTGDKKYIVDQLIEQYKNLFGQASVGVCKNAVKDLLIDMSPSERPSLLA